VVGYVPLLGEIPFVAMNPNLFGGRLSTGEMSEFAVAGSITAVCFFIASNLHTSEDFFRSSLSGEIYTRKV